MCGVLLGPTVPIFWLGLLLMLAFSVQVGWFSVSGARGWSSLLLPVLTIGLGGMALVARVTRVAMIEAAQRDFLLLLHARGMHSMRIQLRRLRHALIPMVTILTFRIGWVLGGAVTVEVVFARSGLGTLFIKSLNQYDYPVVQACLLLLAMAVMLGTFLGDSCKPRWSRTFRRRCTDSTSFQIAALMRAARSPRGQSRVRGWWRLSLWRWRHHCRPPFSTTCRP